MGFRVGKRAPDTKPAPGSPVGREWEGEISLMKLLLVLVSDAPDGRAGVAPSIRSCGFPFCQECDIDMPFVQRHRADAIVRVVPHLSKI